MEQQVKKYGFELTYNSGFCEITFEFTYPTKRMRTIASRLIESGQLKITQGSYNGGEGEEIKIRDFTITE